MEFEVLFPARFEDRHGNQVVRFKSFAEHFAVAGFEDVEGLDHMREHDQVRERKKPHGAVKIGWQSKFFPVAHVSRSR